MNKKKARIIILFLAVLFSITFVSVKPCQVEAKTKKVTSGNKQVDKKARSIIKKKTTSKMSDLEKIKAIHDYMALNCDYDIDNYNKGTIPSTSYSAKGVLIKKKAVCQGYAVTFKLFMDMLGIPCKLVRGTANNGKGYGGHAWNIVKVKGKWYHVDVTWDDPVNGRDGVYYNYFMITDKQMAKNHRWKRSDYPKCKSDISEKVIKLIGKPSKTLDRAVADFYKDYKKNNGKKCTIILKKKLYQKSKWNIYFLVEAKYNLVLGRRAVSTQEVGDYYIVTNYFDSADDKKLLEDSIEKYGEPAETLEQAVDAFYVNYNKSNENDSTIIINKSIYESVTQELTTKLSEKYNLVLCGYSSSTQPCGDYYIITYSNIKKS